MKESMSPRAISLLLVAAGGLCLIVGYFYPRGVVLEVPGMALIVAGFRRVGSRRDALWFTLAGVAFYQLIGAHFILVLTRFSAWAAALYPVAVLYYWLSWLFIVFGARFLERRAGVPRTLGLVLLWPVAERLKAFSDLSLPADAFGSHAGGCPEWLSWTPWTGPFGYTLGVCVAGALLEFSWRAWRERSGRTRIAAAVAGCVVLWWGPLLTGVLQGEPEAEGRSALRAGIVQPVIGLQDKLDRTVWPALWTRLTRLTRDAARGADLVVWPESSRPGPIIWREGQPLEDPEMLAVANEVGVPILYGCEIALVRGRQILAMYNGAVLVRPGHGVVDWYGKQRLLPFIEGMPFSGLFGSSPKEAKSGRVGRTSLLTVLGNFRPGPKLTLFEVDGARLGVLVCYEGMYPQIGQEFREAGANVLVVITNDAWWGQSTFPRWHAHVTGLQARALDVPVVRAANSGISSRTNRAGKMVARTELDEVTTFAVTVTPAPDDLTPYARWGDLTLLALLGLTLAGWAAARRPGPRARSGD